MTIGERIREARTAKGLTQEQLAEQVHVTKQAVYKYETGIVTNIPLDKLESIAACLGVAPGYLAGWQGSPAGAELDALIQDEPIAAYQNLKDQLTQADKDPTTRGTEPQQNLKVRRFYAGLPAHLPLVPLRQPVLRRTGRHALSGSPRQKS